MLSLCPLCPEKLKPPGEQTDSISLPLNWGSPASLRRHYHLVNTLCIGFPGKPRSSVHGVLKSKPNPRPTHPSHSGAQGPLSCTQAAPSWSLPQCTVTFHLGHLLPALWGCGWPGHPTQLRTRRPCLCLVLWWSLQRGACCAGKAQGGFFRRSRTFARLSTVFPVG